VTTSRVLSHAPNKRVWRTSKNYALNSEYTFNNEVCLATGVYGISADSKQASMHIYMYSTCTYDNLLYHRPL